MTGGLGKLSRYLLASAGAIGILAAATSEAKASDVQQLEQSLQALQAQVQQLQREVASAKAAAASAQSAAAMMPARSREPVVALEASLRMGTSSSSRGRPCSIDCRANKASMVI